MQSCRSHGFASSSPKFIRLVCVHKPRNTGVNAQYTIIRRVNIQLCIFLNYTFIEGKLKARIIQPAKITRPRRLVNFRLETETIEIYEVPWDPRMILIGLQHPEHKGLPLPKSLLTLHADSCIIDCIPWDGLTIAKIKIFIWFICTQLINFVRL